MVAEKRKDDKEQEKERMEEEMENEEKKKRRKKRSRVGRRNTRGNGCEKTVEKKRLLQLKLRHRIYSPISLLKYKSKSTFEGK